MEKKLLCLVLAFVFAVGLGLTARAEDLALPAPSCILMEKDTGQILYESNAHEKLRPASVTKIMTLLLVMEALDNGSIGWDDTPRFPHKTQKDVVHLNQSPQSFAAFLQKAKEYCDKHPDQPKLITVYAWNEWVEGAYLLPDMKYGFDYLNAVKDVMVDGKYEKYTK